MFVNLSHRETRFGLFGLASEAFRVLLLAVFWSELVLVPVVFVLDPYKVTFFHCSRVWLPVVKQEIFSA